MDLHIGLFLGRVRCVVLISAALFCCSSALAQIAGTNVNMVSGTQWPGGDPFLQRQNEPSIAVSSRNPFHLLAGANDYRSVDLALTTNGETGDAWLGLFKSLDSGATWRSILLPGCPYATTICSGAPAVKNAGYQAAADPTVRAGTNGMFYYSGLVFNRGFNPASAIIVSRLIDLNNKENADPNDVLNGDSIQYVSTSVVATGTQSSFLDKPTMAVDVPRFGAGTCNLSVNQPGNGLVNQSFAAGNVYVTYTAFQEAPNTDPENATGPQLSTLYFVRSTNCGATWSKPLAISGNIAINQGTSIAIDPNLGTVYVAWREFHYQSGNINQPDAIVVAASFDGGRDFTPPLRISTFAPFDEGTTTTSFRTNAYPTITVDNSSRVYVAYAARNTVPSGDARIVLTNSFLGLFWSTPVPIDNPPIDSLANPLGRGHQIMPALTFAGGKLSLLYYDLRLDHTYSTYSPLLNLGQPTGLYSQFPELAGELALNPPEINAVFNQFIDDSTITVRRHTFDLRMTQAMPGRAPVFTPSVLVSQYAYGCCAANQTDIEQLEFNVPNLPLFRSGTAPFMGDYVDLAPGPTILPPTSQAGQNAQGNDNNQGDEDGDSDDWHFNTSASTPTIYHATWTDNRDVQPPTDGDWTHYTPPNSPSLGTTSIFQPGTTPPACQPGFTGSRNQNIYTAPISGGLIFGAPSNSKTLGTTVFNGQTVPFQRAFVVVAQNTTQVAKSFRLTIANQPTGGSASFLQFSLLTTLDLSIPPFSSASRPVFVVSTNPTASVTVNIAEITAPQGTLVPSGLTGSTTLNPDATNPGITNPTETNPGITNPGITNFEVTDPGITNPGITNPTLTNPGITNPGITNPGITNSTFQNETVVNPGITNPGITNPGITNPTIADPGITNPGITNTNPANVSISDTQWTVVNNGNTTGAYTLNLASSSTVPQGNVLQLIISKLYQTPAAPTGTNCNLAVQTHYGIVTNIVNPAVLSPTDPGITNPGITNPGITNATVSLAPGEMANIDVRVINTDFHTFPTFNPAASIVPVAVSQSVDTQVALASGGTGTIPPPPVSVPPLIITTTSLPDGVAGAVYTALIGTQGGNPTAHAFTVTAGTLPAGLTINATTGAITGIPTAVGTSTFTVQVQDVGSTLFTQHTTTQQLSIRISAPLTITTAPTLAAATQGGTYSQAVATTGGTGPFTFSVVAGALAAGVTMNSAGVIAGIPTGTGTSTFTVQVTDSSNPPQVTIQTFTITVTNPQIPAVVTFATQPQNSVEGQMLANSPIQVRLTDATGAPIANVNVGMILNGPAPCATAQLDGTVPQTTDVTGTASFADLRVNRGQAGFSLLATAGNAVGTSTLFNVEGYCDTGSMATGRHNHQVITLANGKILVAGGDGNANFTGALASAELYDPATHTFSTVGSMHAARVDFTTTLLQNGQVLVTGGFSDTTVNASAELFDPSTNTFTLLPNSMTIPRSEHAATLLANGKVLITGGNNLAGVAVASAEIFDPTTNAFTATSHPMNAIRQIHHADLVTNGQVLISGGFDVNNLPLASAELYDPVSDSFTLTGSMTTARGNHGSALLYNGKVLVAGGLANGPGGLVLSATAELYDPSTGTFAQTGSMSIPRATYAPIVLNDGTVFISAGAALPAGATANIYDPAAGTFRSTGSFTIQQAGVRNGILGDGTVLLMSGVNAAGAVIANSEIFYPIAPPASLTVTTTAVGNAVQDRPYTQVLLEKGGVGNLLWTLASGALPPGVTLSTSGILSGRPTAAGTFSFTVQVVDSATPQKTATSGTLTITVTGVPLQFTSNTVPTAGFGRFYSQPLPIIGGTLPYTVTQTAGTLPPGLSLSGNGVLEGTPSGAGSFTFTVQATDSSAARQTATQTFTIAINTLFITTTVLPSGIVGVPYNAAISTSGGTLPLSFSLATAAFPPGLTIQQPAPGSNAGALAGTPTAAGEFTFSESVVDSSNPRQTATQNYVVTIAPAGTAVPASLTFVTQPQNSLGGQTLNGGPITVSVTDASNNPIPATTVAMSLTGVFGTPLPCATAILSGTLEGVTDATGRATFSSLSIDRGGFDYALAASTGSVSQTSGPFSVQGFCGSGNLSTAREFQTQYNIGTAQSTFKFPVDPKGAYTFTNTNPAAPGAPDIPDAPLIIPLASLGIKPGNVITGLPVGDTNACSPGSFCFGEFFQPSTCAVFSSSNTLLPSGGTINRIPGAIAPDFTTAFSCFTPPTAFGNLPTDIPQDFVLFGEPVTVPPGAAFLFVALADSFYTDNSDPNGDFGVEITVNSPSSVNGEVLIAGGEDNNGNALSTAELYHPALGFTSPTGNLSDPNGRALQATAMLANGKILLAGGASNVTILASAELYDPATGTFTPTGSMTEPRFFAEAALLADGRVLVTGGFNTNVALNTAEIYDPSTGLFTPTGSMNEGRGRHQMTLLPNGKVLVTGGRDAAVNFRGLSSAEIFDPAANQGAGAFTLIGNMNSIRFVHTATLLSNGTVLIAGGFNAGNESLSVTSAETFDPNANTFTLTGSMNISRARFTATLLPDGTVLMAGGIDSVQGVAAPAPSEIYSPATGTFTLTGAMITGRELTRATQLVNGNVLVAGGDDGVNVLSSTEVYYNTVPQAPIVITTTSLPNGFISQPYVRLLLSQNRSGPISWSVVSGTLPPGLSLFGTLPPGISAGAGASGVLSGTPTATGSFTFTLQATDGISTATSTFTINVSVATLAFTSSAMPAGGVGRAYSQPLPVTGGTLPYTATVTGGTLPPGLALSSTGVLSGTPSAVGSFTFTVNVTDASTPTQSAAQTLTIAIDNLFITTTALPDGIAGVPYNATITASGGTPPLVFSAATAAFPPGLTIQPIAGNQQSVALFGTPTLVGHYTFTETVTDSSNPVQGASQIYSMDVLPAGASAVPATVTFVQQPQNSVGGQILSGSPVRVQVRDANNAPVGGASVAISFNGAPPCSSAVLSGTLNGITGPGGNAVFPNLSIDRGQLGYTLLASAGSASAVSQPFTVNGFCPTNGPMSTPRLFHSAVTLPNGTVLVTGGGNTPAALPLNSTELFNPSTGTFSSVAAMNVPRWGHTMTLLNNGKVLITGGVNSPSSTVASVTNTAEIYDPATGTFTLTAGTMGSARYLHSATLLLDGRVLVAGGGTAISGGGCFCTASAVTATSEIFDPATGLFTPTATNLATARYVATATLLTNGQVLISGGAGAIGLTLASAELYDPISSRFAAAATLSASRYFHSASLLPSGKVLIAGGESIGASGNVVLQTAEIYEAAAGTFAPAGNLTMPRAFFSPESLPDGTLLLPGGVTSSSSSTPTNSAEIYNSGSGTFSVTGTLSSAAVFMASAPLQDGKVLTTGGVASSGATSDAEVYYSTAPLAPLAITTTSLANGEQGRPYTQILLEQGGVGTLTWTLTSGSLPPGITLRSDGVLIGTPTATGTFTFAVRVVDRSTPQKNVVSGNFILTVGSALTVPAQAFNTGIVGTPYGGAISASGGTPPYSFAITSGATPAGITLLGNGQFTGTPTLAGTSTFTVQATDSSPSPQTASQTFSIQVVNPLAISTAVLPGGTVGVPYSATVSSTGGVAPVTFVVGAGTFPPGLSLASNGAVSGTPTSAGPFTFSETVTDSSTPAQTASQTYTVTIAPALAQSWTLLAPTGGPPSARGLSGSAYDSATNQMIIFGGQDSVANRNDVWSLSLGASPQWTQLSPGGSPPLGRVGPASAYDGANSRMIVFGGGLGHTSPCVNDVWVLANANSVGGTPTWTQLSPSGTAPGPRWAASAIYSPASNTMTLFGGNNCFSTRFNDVWVLSNANGLGGTPVWTQLAPSGTPPPATNFQSAIYDQASNRMILFGINPTNALNQDAPTSQIWVLTNANGLGGTPTWIQLLPLSPGPVKTDQATVYDASSNTMIVFGGFTPGATSGTFVYTNDTWVLSNANGLGSSPTWTQLNPSGGPPAVRASMDTVYDPATKRMVIFGGGNQTSSFNDAWTLTVNNPVLLAALTFNTAIVGTPYGGAITASGGTAPYSFAIASGASPAGITLLGNGQFTGTPTTPGTSSFTVTVTDSSVSPQTASQTFSIQVVNPLAISPTTLPGGTVGVPYSAMVSSTGGVAPVNFVVGAGPFPPGLSLASTGAISGTPTSAGPFTFTVSATDSSTPAQTALQSYTVTIALAVTNQAPVVSAAAGAPSVPILPPSMVITEYPIPSAVAPQGMAVGPDSNLWVADSTGNQIWKITTSGVSTPFPVLSGGRPTGITAGPDSNLWFTEFLGNRIGRITTSGTITEFTIPTSGSTEPFGVTAGPDGNLWFTEVTANHIGRITTTGVITEFTIPTSGSSPEGITSGPDGNVWFVEAGTSKIGRITPNGTITEFSIPTANSDPVGIAGGVDGNLWFTEFTGNRIGRITTSGAITEFAIPTTSSQPEFITAGQDGNLWFVEEVGNNVSRITTSGVITEFPIPSANSSPTFGIVTGPDGYVWFTEQGAIKVGKINPLTSVAVATLAGSVTDDGLPGGNLTATWSTVSGPGPVTFSSPSISFPDVARQLTTLRTQARFNTPGAYMLRLSVTDSQLTTTSDVNVTVNSTLLLGAQTLNAGVVGTPYGGGITASGGTAPYSFAITSGQAPAGISLLSNGQFTGTPTGVGTSTFTVQATDSSPLPQTAPQTFTINVVAALVITTTVLPGGTVGVAYNQPIVTTGGTLPLSFSLATPAFPPGLGIQNPPLTSNAGALVGTPITTGTFTFTETVTDSSSPQQTATQSYTVTIASNAGTPAHVTFIAQPQNSIASQPMANPIRVLVTDPNFAVVPGTSVTLGFNGAPACANATINGGSSQTAITDATGTATFSGLANITIDRGHTNYTLAATAGSVKTVSTPFNVEGFCTTATPSSARLGGTATLLPNGKVLLTGGVDAGSSATVVATAELYDPVAHTFTATGSMSAARAYHTATLLNDGTVLVAGGTSTVSNQSQGFQPGAALSSAEVYNPAIGTFTPVTAAMTGNRALHAATALNDGTLLIAGGFTGTATGAKLNSGEIYDPVAHTFTPLASTMAAAREALTATLLPDGRVLLAGGFSATKVEQSADLYSPATKTFTPTTTPMVFPHAQHTATLLNNGTGEVAIVGGVDSNVNAEVAVELFDPLSGTFFSPNASLSPAGRGGHNATALTDGRVLIDGGFDFNLNFQPSAETLSLGTIVSTPTSDMQFARSGSTATLLQDETVLLAGGTFTGPLGGQVLSTQPAEIFYPADVLPFSIPTLQDSVNLNAPFQFQLRAIGGLGSLSWQATPGTLPPGVTLSAAGLLSGTPTVSGSFSFTAQATDSSAPPQIATGTFFLFVSAPQLFINPVLPDANPGVAYSQAVVVSGGTVPYSFTLTSGALPGGLSLSSSGVVSGTTSTTGTFTFIVQVTDSSSPPLSAAQTIMMSVAAPLTITTSSLPNGAVGTFYSATITATGGLAPLNFAGGGLPPGLNMSTSGVLSGTPTTSGTFTFEVQVSDASASPELAFQLYTISITGTPVASMTFVNFGRQFDSTNLVSGSVRALDALNNPVPSTMITVAVANNPCPTEGSSSALVVTDATGTATFTVDILGGGFGYTLSATSFDHNTTSSAPFNVAGSCFGATPNAARYGATTTVLSTGQVLVAGGQNGTTGNPAVASAEIYDPVAAKFTLTGNMTVARAFHSATLLPTGKVLIVGGLSEVEPTNVPLASVEAYDPLAGTFSSLGLMSVPRFNHTATLMPDGTVLVAGGNNGSGAVASAEIINPATGTLTLLPNSMNAAREQATATMLPNGSVLIAGGLDMPRTVPPGLASAEIYNPSNQSFTLTAPMNSGHAGHTATLLSPGKVLIAGGENVGLGGETANLTVAELYDPGSDTFSLTGSMSIGRALHSAVLLQDQKVLVAGGDFSFGLPGGSDFEIYDPATGTFSLKGSPLLSRSSLGAALLSNGNVLLVGGALFTVPAEIYFPPVAPIIFLTNALPNGASGTFYSASILTTGGFAPVTMQVTSGSLPTGLLLGTQGQLTGMPAGPGTFTFTVAATDSSTVAKDSLAQQTASQAFTITVN